MVALLCLSSWCLVTVIHHGFVGWSAVCVFFNNCRISYSYSLAFSMFSGVFCHSFYLYRTQFNSRA